MSEAQQFLVMMYLPSLALSYLMFRDKLFGTEWSLVIPMSFIVEAGLLAFLQLWTALGDKV